jgi:serine/threonine protein kinase
MAAALECDSEEQPADSAYAPTTPMSAGSTAGFTPPEAASLARYFPQLEILEPLGHGGMGAVYRARQTKLDRLVALKIIRPEAAADTAFAERFNREARTLARLSHPNIVGVHDFGEVMMTQDGVTRPLYFFVMEYVDGANLRRLIESGELTPEQALAIVPQICEALQYAHDEGVVHRDIKPENILLDARGRVKIADFGLAKLAARAADEFTLTATHQVMGTPRYMAPEQMAGSHDVDHRADIYSLGVVLYEMLTGEVPMGHFEPPSKRAAIDARLDEVVLRSLASDPDRRYQQADELKSSIENISSPFAETHVRSQPSPRPSRGVSTIVEREVAAAWRFVAGLAEQKTIRERPQVPALLMFLLAVAGCLTILFPWADVVVERVDARRYETEAADTSAAGEVEWTPARREPAAQGVPSTVTAYGYDGDDEAFAVLGAFVAMALLVMIPPPNWRQTFVWSLLMCMASTAALVCTLLVADHFTLDRISLSAVEHLVDTGAVAYDFGFYGSIGLSAVLLLLGLTGVRYALAYRGMRQPVGPVRGESPLPRVRFSVPGQSSHPADPLKPVAAKESSATIGGRDWVTLTREQIESDRLPDVCIVCGEATGERLNRDFSFQADWAQVLTVIGMICGVFPGLIVAGLTERRQRIACPVCPTHRNPWSKYAWFAGTGWLLSIPFGAAGALAGWPLSELAFFRGTEGGPIVVGGVIGALLGLVVYGVLLARMASSRPSVEHMTATDIRLRPVSPTFARAAENMRPRPDSL